MTDLGANKQQPGFFVAIVRKLFKWGSEPETPVNANVYSSSKSYTGESNFSAYEQSTEVSSLAPSGRSTAHSGYGGHIPILIGGSFASPIASPTPGSSPDPGAPGARTTTLGTSMPSNIVVSVVEPLNNPSSTHRTSSQRVVAADAASVLTIASSSKRRRRRSLDTNASTRALFAESIFSATDVE